MKYLSIYIGMAVMATIGIAFLAPQRDLKKQQLKIRQLQERFKSLDAV